MSLLMESVGIRQRKYINIGKVQVTCKQIGFKSVKPKRTVGQPTALSQAAQAHGQLLL